ncbi:glycosyltransferase family 4 protein [Leifsonia lichenia]
MNRTRRTVLVAHPSSELYGSDRVLLESVTALVDDGWDVVVTVPDDGPLLPEVVARGARVRRCAAPVVRKSALRPLGFVRFIGTAVRGLVDGMRLLRQERPALVYVNTVTVPLWIGLGRLARVPVLCHVHEGESSASPLLRRILAMPLLFANTIVANSRFSVGVLGGSFASLERRAEVVYNAVPGPPEQQPVRSHIDGDLRVTYIGRLSPRKGVDVAIDAIAELDQRGIGASLDLVGAVFPGYEWYEEALREQVTKNNLGDRVRFRGFQPSVWEYVHDGDVVLVPSRADEPFGNTAVEAILSGRPVIASATSGLLEATAGYASATTVVPGSSASLADALVGTIAEWEGTRANVGSDVAAAERRHSPDAYRRRIAAIVRSNARTR